MSKKILVDMTVYQIGSAFHGGGEYSYTVLYALLDKKDPESVVDIFIGERGRRDDEFLSEMERRGVGIHTCQGPKQLEELIKEGGYEVVYSSLPTIQYFGGIKISPDVRLVITIHGLRKTELKEEGLYPRFQRLGTLKQDVKEALLRLTDPDSYKKELAREYGYILDITDNFTLITGSMHSYYSLIRHFPKAANKLKMYLCPGKSTFYIDDPGREEQILTSFGVEHKNFGLMLSMDRMEKNPVRNMKAWDMVFEDAPFLMPEDFKAVGLGAKEPEKYLKHVKHRDRFIIKGYVDDDELETLYKHAHVVIFTSLNEGFGYPPMEAMKYNTMVVASVNTSIPESCGEAAFMCNPLMPTEIANRIMQSFDPGMKEEKESLIPLQYKKIIELQNEALGSIVREVLQ